MIKSASDNEIIGYYDGKAIVKDENNQYFFLRIPIEYVTFGETVFPNDLCSIYELHPAELADLQDYIMKVGV